MSNSVLSLEELAVAAGAIAVHGDPATPVSSIHYDSREVRPGGMFIALRGGYVDGHDFLGDALRRGASSALVETEELATGYPAFAVVENTRAALSPLAARFYDYPGQNLGVVGITGTDGKTTTSFMIDALLRSNGLRTGLIGTIAVRIADQLIEHDSRQTTPESLEVQRLLADMQRAGVDWAVLEATSHALALYRLDDCPFDIAVVTNVTREHLDFHGSLEAYRAAKARLLERVSESSDRSYSRGAVINADDEGARAISTAATGVPVTWFSLHDENADIFAHSIRPHQRGTAFKLKVADRETDVDLKQIGSYNVLNSMAAAGVGHVMGLDLDVIRTGLESLENVPGRMQRIEAGQPFSVIVDYAHSPASLEETLRLVRSVTPGRIITVFGSAGERDKGKRAVQGRISAEIADLSIFTSEDPRFEDPDEIIRQIAEGAESAGATDGREFYCIEDRRLAIAAAMDAASPGDTILLAGKGHEKCMIYGDQRVPWNEAHEAMLALNSRGYEAQIPETDGSE